MISRNYCINVFIYLLSFLLVIQCQVTDEITPTELNYISIKHIPPVLHNDNVYIAIIYKCTSILPRRISLSVYIERTLYHANFAVFRRYWFCHKSTRMKVRYLRVNLHRSIAYAPDKQSSLQSWPFEHGRLRLVMYKFSRPNENEILKTVEYDVKFLPVYQRPSYRSFRWNPLRNNTIVTICSLEPDVVRVVDYPLVLTGGKNGKHFVLPSYQDYGLRFEYSTRVVRPKFSIVFWLYIHEYCEHRSAWNLCAVLQHLTFNNTHLTPEIFLTTGGQISVTMFTHTYDQYGSAARTLAQVPKRDWCRLAFVVNEYTWTVYINCLRHWNQPIIATHTSDKYFYSHDELGTYIVGGTDQIRSFRGFIGQVDVFRRTALTYDQLPKKIDLSFMPFLPSTLAESQQCQHYYKLFNQSREQSELFHRLIQEKLTCDAQPFSLYKSNQQCLLVRTWKEKMQSPSSTDIRFRIFRALRRRKLNSTEDLADKLYNVSMKLLEKEDAYLSCKHIVAWTEQAMCYGHISAHSLLATFYQFGLCGLQVNTTRALQLLFSGAILNDRISLLALGHRHFYGLDGVPVDYDSAYVYYQQMAEKAKNEFYNPIAGEVSMEHVRLTDDKLIGELTFDKSESFYWLTQQAKRGVASAQRHLGSIMYAGRNGLTRNIQAAVEYFRMGAAQNDATSLFGYGLALLSGQGTKQNVEKAIQHIEKAVKQGLLGAKVTLGYHAYEIEKNYTKAAILWQECFDKTSDAYCAHNLGVLWTAGHYPPDFVKDHVKAWRYFSFAAQHGQVDSKLVVSFYNARGGHPVIIRNPLLAAIWSRFVAQDSSALGTIVRRALEAYRDGRWQTSFIFYLHAALTGVAPGYFNAGFLCNEIEELKYNTSIHCIEDLLDKYLMVHGNHRNADSYAILHAADYHHLTKKNISRTIELYIQLYQDGDAHGLYNLAQIEERSDSNETMPLSVWTKLGITLDNKTLNNRHKRLQSIYQHCRTLKTHKSHESYIPCTLAYLRVSAIVMFYDQIMLNTIILVITISAIIFVFRT